MSPKFKEEHHKLSFRYLNQNLIYPGVTVLTWMMVIPGVWQLVQMEPLENE